MMPHITNKTRDDLVVILTKAKLLFWNPKDQVKCESLISRLKSKGDEDG